MSTPEEKRARARELRKARWEAMTEEQREHERAKARERTERHKREHPEYWEARNKRDAAARMARYRNDPEFHADVNEYQRELMRKRAAEGKA